MITIITRDYKKIGQTITDALGHRTFTRQSGIGGRTEETFSMVRAIETKEELPRLIEVVESADPDCFFYHHDIEGTSKRYPITPVG